MALRKPLLVYIFVKLNKVGLVSPTLGAVLDREWLTNGKEIWEGVTTAEAGGRRQTQFVTPTHEDNEVAAERTYEFGRDHLLKGEAIVTVKVRKKSLDWRNFEYLAPEGGLYNGDYTIGAAEQPDLKYFGFCPKCGGDTEWTEEAVQYCNCHGEVN